MISGSIARRYAKALLGIGIADRAQEKYGSELRAVSSLYQASTEFREAMDHAIFQPSERQKVLVSLAKLMSLSAPVIHLLQLLLSRGKFLYLPAVAREFQTLSDRHLGKIRGRLTTASPMDQTIELRIQGALEKISSQKVVLERLEDTSILGGFILHIGDVVYDGSVLGQLKQLRQELSGQKNIVSSSQE